MMQERGRRSSRGLSSRGHSSRGHSSRGHSGEAEVSSPRWDRSSQGEYPMSTPLASPPTQASWADEDEQSNPMLSPQSSVGVDTPTALRHSVDSRSCDSYASFSAFAQRGELWELRRSQRCQELRQQQDAKEFAECYFHPSVGSRAPRRSSSHAAGRVRLDLQTVLSSEETSALVARLSQQSIGRRMSPETVPTTRDRQELQAFVECTFQPDTAKSSRSYQRLPASGESPSTARAISSSCSRVERAKRRLRVAEDQAGRELTFLPQTNGVSLDMVNTQAYLREDVFARLSQATTAEPPDTPPPPLLRSHSDSSVCANGHASLHRFLERQNLQEKARLRRLGDLEAAHAPPLQPALCERSLRLAEQQRQRGGSAAGSTLSVAGFVGLPPRASGGEASVVSRPAAVAGVALEKSKASVAEPPADPECTFRPRITRAARERQARSPSQLGPGDAERRAARRAKASEEQKRREFEQLQAPKINSYNGITGRLRIRKDADTLMERIEKTRVAERKRCEQDAKRQQELEDAQCPFRPQVKPAPAFVQRMAATRRASRVAALEKENGAAQQQQQQHRPEWQ